MPEQQEPSARREREELHAAVAEARPKLLQIAERLCGNAADAADLLQDVIERVLRQGIPAEVRNMRAWLTTSLHNLFVDRCRSNARKPHHEPIDDHQHEITQLEPDPPEPAWTRITIADIRAALDAIDPVYREVYILHTFEHQSYEQIAQRQGVQRITVGTRLTRARKKLREVLLTRLGLEDQR